jgi:putative MFS transporter
MQHGWVWLVVTGYLLAFFQDGGFSGIVPFTPELYPTRLRSTGVGWANGAGRAAALLAPLLVGSLVAAHLTGVVFAVCAGCYLVAAAVVGIVGREPATIEEGTA